VSILVTLLWGGGVSLYHGPGRLREAHGGHAMPNGEDGFWDGLCRLACRPSESFHQNGPSKQSRQIANKNSGGVENISGFFPGVGLLGMHDLIAPRKFHIEKVSGGFCVGDCLFIFWI